MTRIQKAAEIISGGVNSLETSESPGVEDDFLSRVNRTITNFKELVKLGQQFRGLDELGAGDQGAPGEELTRTPKGTTNPGLAEYVNLIMKSGYGDTPVGQLIEKISPYTLRQILEVIKRAGPK